MRTTTVYNSLVVMAVVAVVSGCASTGSANRSIQPPFEWDVTGEFATPGTSLTLTELERSRMEEKVIVYYEIRATGFSPEESLHFWKRSLDEEFGWLAAAVDADGLVRVTGFDRYPVFGFAPGEAVDVALVSATNDKRAHARAFPYPIEEHGTNGCSILMSVESLNRRSWLATLRGFEPGQPIEIVSQYGGGTKNRAVTASDTGEYRWFVGFKPPARGVASITATSGDRTVSVEYNVGYDAVNPKDATQSAP